MNDNYHSIEKQVSYIIGYRESINSRKAAFQYVLNWIYSILPELEVLIIEQDERPRISVKLPPNCRKIFVYNAGLFNRSWAFNIALHHSNKEILAFADADTFLSKENYLECFNACLTFDAVTPNALVATNIHSIDLENFDFQTSDKRWILFGSMMLMMKRKALEKIGGWDERYEGWGWEDNAISHVILQLLTNKSFNHDIFHIDHHRSVFDGATQPKYLYSQQLFQEILTLSSKSLARFCNQESKLTKGDPLKYSINKRAIQKSKPKFVLAITLVNDLGLLEDLLCSWRKFKTDAAEWELIIADDDANEKVLTYLENLQIEKVSITIISNRHKGIPYLYNCIFRKLKNKPFDLCFCVKPDIYFKRKGWDNLYWKIVKRTGVGQLIFQEGYATPKDKTSNIGFFSNLQEAPELKDNFFTITPSVLEKIGYMDTNQLGFSHLAFLDYYYRSCKEGFNDKNTPFDALGSRDYIGVKIYKDAIYSSVDILKQLDKIGQFVQKRNILQSNRNYLPWNELDLTIPEYYALLNEKEYYETRNIY